MGVHVRFVIGQIDILIVERHIGNDLRYGLCHHFGCRHDDPARSRGDTHQEHRVISNTLTVGTAPWSTTSPFSLSPHMFTDQVAHGQTIGHWPSPVG